MLDAWQLIDSHSNKGPIVDSRIKSFNIESFLWSHQTVNNNWNNIKLGWMQIQNLYAVEDLPLRRNDHGAAALMVRDLW